MKNTLKLLAVALLACGLSVHAADFHSLAVGQPLDDGSLRIGQYKIRLPEGTWVVAGKLEARAGSQGGSAGTPSQLWTSVARVEAGTVTALITFRTPASTFVGVQRWNDDPCKGVENPLALDTMKQTFAMPECFTVTRYGPENITAATSGYSTEVARWLKESQTRLPEKMWRVYYSKYHGGDFLHMYVQLPATSESHATAESWGRAVAAALQAMVVRDVDQAALPALP